MPTFTPAVGCDTCTITSLPAAGATKLKAASALPPGTHARVAMRIGSAATSAVPPPACGERHAGRASAGDVVTVGTVVTEAMSVRPTAAEVVVM